MFGFGEKTFVGIDIGTASIKIVELKMQGNRPLLANYAKISMDVFEKNKDPKSAYFDFVVPKYIKKMLEEAKIKSNEASFSVPSFGGLVILVEFPDIAEKDLDQAIMFEAKKYIPMSLDDVVLSWDVIKRADEKTRLFSREKQSIPPTVTDQKVEGNKTTKIDVLLVAAPKSKIIQYKQIAKEANLKINLIEIESFSLVRSLIGDDQGNFVIIDIGSRVCNIILVEKGTIKVNRNMDAGGRDMTKIIARSMNVDTDRAEKMKITGGNFLAGESSIKFPVLDLIVGEVNRMINTYYGEEHFDLVDAIILSGGTANFSGLEEYFFKGTKIKTIIGNPLGRLEYDKRLEAKKKEIGNLFSVAIGLALGEINASAKKNRNVN